MKLWLAYSTILVLALAACGVSKVTGSTQNCTTTFSEEDTSTSSTTSATQGDTVLTCGPQDSPNKPKTVTTTTLPAP